MKRSRLGILAAALLAAGSLAPDAAPAQDGFGFPAQAFAFGTDTDAMRILPTGRLFTSDNVIYTEGRTTVVLGESVIDADRMAIDLVTLQVVAEGDVVFTRGDTVVRASSARYDFRVGEGIGYDVDGEHEGFFFRARRDEDAKGPAFQMINPETALIRDSSFTYSGFPVPTWYIKAREVSVVVGERAFVRGATLYIRSIPDHLGITRDVPVFWFPAFTFRLDGIPPWSFAAGYLSRYGGYLSIGYDYEYETRTPDWEDPTVYRTRTQGRMGVRGDLFTSGAVGVGIDGRYSNDFERHLGSLTIYGVRDPVREIETADGSSGDSTVRYIYRHRHNSLFGDTILQLNLDWLSDPDVYYDILDQVGGPMLSTRSDGVLDRLGSDTREGRRQERRLRAAATYLQQDYAARLTLELKERVSRDRYGNFTDPQDRALEFDFDPDFTQSNDITTDGLSSDRYGRVSQRVQGRVATRLLPVARTPLFWRSEVNAFSAIDPGFNENNSEDDARITGLDWYNSLTNRIRLGRRFTWSNTVGVGLGVYSRDSDNLVAPGSLGSRRPGRDGTTAFDPIRTGDTEGVERVDGLRMRDSQTLLVGEGDRELNTADIDPFFAWADYRSRLNARFTDSLAGYLQYTIREGSQDGFGQFYEFAGRQVAFEDVYDFPLSYHWIESFLDYTLAYPDLNLYTGAGYNLQSADISANERLWYLTAGSRYVNPSGEFDLIAETTLDSRQARDRRDPDEFERMALGGVLNARYYPVHSRYWTELRVSGSIPLDDDPVASDPRRDARYNQNDTDISIRPLIGRQFGPKYAAEVFVDYNTRISGIQSAGVTILRDLYDADLGFFFGVRNVTTRSRDEGDDTSNSRLDSDLEPNFRVSLAIKQPRERALPGAMNIQTMRGRNRRASFVD